MFADRDNAATPAIVRRSFTGHVAGSDSTRTGPWIGQRASTLRADVEPRCGTRGRYGSRVPRSGGCRMGVRRAIAGPVAVLMAVMVMTASVGAAQTITTLPDENDTRRPFGCPNTGAYGQVITVPAGENTLSSFSFRMNLPAAEVFRGMVFAWDGTTPTATGSALFTSGPTSTAGAGMETVTFTTSGVAVVAGQQYVLLAQADCTATPADTNGLLGTVEPGTYAGGDFVFQQNGGDATQLTTGVWETFLAPVDLAFEAVFGAEASRGDDGDDERDDPETTTTTAPAPVAVAAEPRFTG
jgi:hypothetical protein